MRPGETLAFHASCEPGAVTFSARLVRLYSVDDRPDGPGIEAVPVTSSIDGTYPARQQAINAGSYAQAALRRVGIRPERIRVRLRIMPTTPEKPRQALIELACGDSNTVACTMIDGAIAVSIRSNGLTRDMRTMLRPRKGFWYSLDWELTLDGTNRITCEPLHGQPVSADRGSVDLKSGLALGVPQSVTLAAARKPGAQTCDHFNGRIEAPEIRAGDAMWASWDFSRGIDSEIIEDASGNACHGRVFNMPTRAVTGSAWRGQAQDWRASPQFYSAIHFHEDDLADADWESDFSFRVPDDLQSGVYAAELSHGPIPEHVVFFVRPARPSSDTVFLSSSATYQAYANYDVMNRSRFFEASHGGLAELCAADLYFARHPELGHSTYSSHADGSGVCFSSRLRPDLTMRPNGPLWAFGGDGYILSWLRKMNLPVDITTDEDLDREGADALSGYRVLVCGCHPEYVTGRMLDAIEAFLRLGGRLMYLGGNGFYWRCAYHPAAPHVLEVRRAEDGTRAWVSRPGEYYMAGTGEYGGMWRRNGRPPNALVGVGFTAQGFGLGRPYRRTPDGRGPRAKFIFDGVESEIFGNFGFAGGGAAGQEIDRFDPGCGSPAHALVVATADGFDDGMLLCKEELGATQPCIAGGMHPDIRADMTFFETGHGGAVFSVGSISWASSLMVKGGDNDVARITGNVIRRFRDSTPFSVEN